MAAAGNNHATVWTRLSANSRSEDGQSDSYLGIRHEYFHSAAATGRIDLRHPQARCDACVDVEAPKHRAAPRAHTHATSSDTQTASPTMRLAQHQRARTCGRWLRWTMEVKNFRSRILRVIDVDIQRNDLASILRCCFLERVDPLLRLGFALQPSVAALFSSPCHRSCEGRSRGNGRLQCAGSRTLLSRRSKQPRASGQRPALRSRTEE